MIDIIITYQFYQIPLLRQAPQIIRVVRVVRITKLIKIVKFLDSFTKLLVITRFCLPAILNVSALLFLAFYIYAILGSFLFHSVTTGKDINDYYNFKNFHYSMLFL